MPKARPVSLFPLSVEEAIDALLKGLQKPQKKGGVASKPKKRKKANTKHFSRKPALIRHTTTPGSSNHDLAQQ